MDVYVLWKPLLSKCVMSRCADSKKPKRLIFDVLIAFELIVFLNAGPDITHAN